MFNITLKIVNIEIRIWLMKCVFTQTNMINTVDVTGSLWTVIHISMVIAVHGSGPANTGKSGSIYGNCCISALALRWTGISRRLLLSTLVPLLGCCLCWRILHFGRIRRMRAGIHLWLNSLFPSALVGRRVCSRPLLGHVLQMLWRLSH